MPATIVSRWCARTPVGFLAASLALVAPAAYSAAYTRTKQNNSTALNDAASWDTPPAAGDIAQWTSIVTAANSPVLGADLSWGGIKITSPGGPVTLGAGHTLTIGTAGIDLSTASQDLTLNCGLTVQGKQSWKAKAGRTLNLAGTFTRSGAVVDFTSFNAAAILGALANDPSGILGPWAVTGSGGTLNYVQSDGGAIATCTGQTDGTADLSNITNAAANFTFGAAATLTGALTANTLRYTGAAASMDNAGFNCTLNGLLQAGTGTLTLAGNGQLIIGAERDLVIIGNTRNTTIYAPIVDHASGASALTYSGGSTTSSLSLYGTNTYSGATRILTGQLACFSNSSSLGGGPLEIGPTAKVGLYFSGTRQVASLSLGGTAQTVNGTYGSTASSATHQSNLYFAGSGTVTLGPLDPYTLWINNAAYNSPALTDPQKLPTADPDNDGMNNQQEFAFGLNPVLGASRNPITQPLAKATGEFKYTRALNTGLVYSYQWSATLRGSWNTFTPDAAVSNSADPVEEITVKVPSYLLAHSTLFVRVKAVAAGGATTDPYADWINSAAYNIPPLSEAQKLPAADPDGDKLNNQQEFAFGLNPVLGSSCNPITQPLGKTTGEFKYTRRLNTGLSYTYEWSATLVGAWNSLTPDSTLSNNADPVEEITVKLPTSLLQAHATLFVRVKAMP